MVDTTFGEPYTTPYIPAPTVTIFVADATPIKPFDFAAESGRSVGVDIGGVSVFLGISGGDAETVRVANRLINALEDLRAAAARRIEEAS